MSKPQSRVTNSRAAISHPFRRAVPLNSRRLIPIAVNLHLSFPDVLFPFSPTRGDDDAIPHTRAGMMAQWQPASIFRLHRSQTPRLWVARTSTETAQKPYRSLNQGPRDHRRLTLIT